MNGQPVAATLHVDMPRSQSERLGELFDSHHDRLYRLARRLTSTADDALDLVQETFLRAARSPKAVPVGPADEESWLVRVLINLRRDQWRSAAVRKGHDRDLADSHSRNSSDPEAALIARNMVWRALDLLTPRRRAIVILHELDGMAATAIASLLGIRTITVRWHLSKGRHDLARALNPHLGVTNENH